MRDSIRSKFPIALLALIVGSLWMLADWDATTSRNARQDLPPMAAPHAQSADAIQSRLDMDNAW